MRVCICMCVCIECTARWMHYECELCRCTHTWCEGSCVSMRNVSRGPKDKPRARAPRARRRLVLVASSSIGLQKQGNITTHNISKTPPYKAWSALIPWCNDQIRWWQMYLHCHTTRCYVLWIVRSIPVPKVSPPGQYCLRTHTHMHPWKDSDTVDYLGFQIMCLMNFSNSKDERMYVLNSMNTVR